MRDDQSTADTHSALKVHFSYIELVIIKLTGECFYIIADRTVEEPALDKKLLQFSSLLFAQCKLQTRFIR